jgi:hypothetical protein
MSFVGSIFTTSLAVYLVYGKHRPSPSNVGFLLDTASMSSLLQAKAQTSHSHSLIALLGYYILSFVERWNGLEGMCFHPRNVGDLTDHVFS